jgi:hypothetical protein
MTLDAIPMHAHTYIHIYIHTFTHTHSTAMSQGGPADFLSMRDIETDTTNAHAAAKPAGVEEEGESMEEHLARLLMHSCLHAFDVYMHVYAISPQGGF